jgi:hypothetical protein
MKIHLDALVIGGMVGGALYVIGCVALANLGPEGCEALVVNAKDQAVRWTRAVDEDKAEEAAEYAYLVADLLAVGCVFVPPPSAPPVEIVP